jgi:activator of 2-hydroxyglutaryl-CoA dehydratase
MLNNHSLGIDIGSCSVKVVHTTDNNFVWHESLYHNGEILNTLKTILKKKNVPPGSMSLVTGGEGRKQTSLKDITPAESIEKALENLRIKPKAVASIGGEELVLYLFNNHGKIVNILSGDKCSSGTGEFFRQQLFRMNMSTDDISSISKESNHCSLSSRCSVFLKSDCTHKLNKGEASKNDIVLSLSRVMAQKIAEFLDLAKITDGEVLLTGGVCKNEHFVKNLKSLKPSLTFLVPKQAPYIESYGASLLASSKGEAIPHFSCLNGNMDKTFDNMEPLNPHTSNIDFIEAKRGKISADRDYILGIDGGSTTTKVTLVDAKTHQICASHYGRTHGDPITACKKCLIEIKNKIDQELKGKPVKISLIATTGSSREILGIFLQTKGVYNEIIAHATGSSFHNDTIDTIFEIGGQDAKYVFLKNGVPIDYAMNEACSAGTGSFLEESAEGDLNIKNVEDISQIALKSKNPIKFGEHCSAFINSDIRAAVGTGAKRADIVAGLVYSVVLNYLNRVLVNRTLFQTF